MKPNHCVRATRGYGSLVMVDQKSPDRPKRDRAKAVIQQIGTSAVPAILPCLNHPDADKSQAAEAAVWVIDPQALHHARSE